MWRVQPRITLLFKRQNDLTKRPYALDSRDITMPATPHPVETTTALLNKNSRVSSWPFKLLAPVGFLGVMIYLCLAILLSTPYLLVKNYVANKRRSRFESRMLGLGRTIDLMEVLEIVKEGRGTILQEHLFRRGWGVRRWWIPNNLLQNSPYQLPTSFEQAHTADFEVACRWLFERYTSPVTGTAKLIVCIKNGKHNPILWHELPPQVELICPTDAYDR